MEPLIRRAASVAHHGLTLLRTGHRHPTWSRVEEEPAEPDPLPQVPLFAIVASYNEADVIEATVRNALVQGASRVYLVDNASTDDTVARAVAAGAIVGETFATESMEDRLRIMLMNAVVWRVSAAEQVPHLWWLWLDADEFPHGPGRMTVAEVAAGVDRRFRVVGSDFYQHFPSGAPQNLEGFHPLDCQPLCEPFWQPLMPRCPARHYKHPLVRFDRSGPFLLPPNSFHSWEANDRTPLLEPRQGLVTHHFPFRDEAVTRRRLQAVYGPDGRGDQMLRRGALTGDRRLRSVDAVYAGRWDRVDNDRDVPGDRGVHPRPWAEWHPDAEPARWYSAGALAAARAAAGPAAGVGR